MTNSMISLATIPVESTGCSNKNCSDCAVSQVQADLDERIQFLANEYLSSSAPWFVGFSGGKDSSAVLKLIYNMLLTVGKATKPITLVYCDTGVDIPTMANYVRESLDAIQVEAGERRIPLQVRIASPPLKDRYFVKVIGRGYATPTNKFRWCTDRLRIQPVSRILGEMGLSEAVVVLGTRSDESAARSRVLGRHALARTHYYRQSTIKSRLILAPIDDFTIRDVWRTLFELDEPRSLNVSRLVRLYRDAGNECPVIRDAKGTPCGSGRFGCWTCTVVRRDKAMTNLVYEGYRELEPLLEYRNWLASIRESRDFRCRFRRNGQKGPGPFTLAARRMMLERLLAVEKAVPWTLIEDDEIDEIKALWSLDEDSPKYRGIQ